jgi:SAM-dependent methyltransferase
VRAQDAVLLMSELQRARAWSWPWPLLPACVVLFTGGMYCGAQLERRAAAATTRELRATLATARRLQAHHKEDVVDELPDEPLLLFILTGLHGPQVGAVLKTLWPTPGSYRDDYGTGTSVSLPSREHASSLYRKAEANLNPLSVASNRSGLGLLQNSFVRMHRFLYQLKLLPLSQWGHHRGSGNMDLAVMGRRGFRRFFQESSHLVPPKSLCLGWDTTRYVDNLVRQCDSSRAWSFVYRERGSARLHNDTRTLLANLVSLSTQPGQLGPLRFAFDLVLVNQVFEHVKQPFEAAAAIKQLLKPGGHAFWSAPFLERFHHSYGSGDFFRYTCMGAWEIFRSAGFELVSMRKVGDSLITSGAILGFGIGDFEPAHEREHLLSDFDFQRDNAERERWLYISCVLVVRRPAIGTGRTTGGPGGAGAAGTVFPPFRAKGG